MSTVDLRGAPRFGLGRSTAVFDDQSYRLDNWSKGGARITGYTGPRQPGESFSIALEVSTAGGQLRLVGHAEVARRKDDELGLTWKLKDDAEELDMLLSLFFNTSEK